MLKYIFFFSFLLVINLSITILYDGNVLVSLMKSVLQKSNKKIWMINGRNLASASSILEPKPIDFSSYKLYIDQLFYMAVGQTPGISKNSQYYKAKKIIKYEYISLNKLICRIFMPRGTLVLNPRIDLVARIFINIYKEGKLSLKQIHFNYMKNNMQLRLGLMKDLQSYIDFELFLKIYYAECYAVTKVIMRILKDHVEITENTQIILPCQIENEFIECLRLMGINPDTISPMHKTALAEEKSIMMNMLESVISYIS